MKGCLVIGSVGSQEKIRWLLDHAKIDHAFNYKEVGEENISAELGPSNLFLAIPNRLKLLGFIVRDHYNLLNEFYADMSGWISKGLIKWNETVFEGLENAPKAFLALFKGENIGKMLVKIGF